MNLNVKSKDLLSRYVIDIGRRLPGRNRKEISREIESTILDMLEDSYEGPSDDGQTQALKIILEDMGHPAKIARSYMKEKYVIGPMIYPFFKKIWAILWIVISVALAARLVFILMEKVNEQVIFGFLGTALNAYIISFGMLVMIFFIMEKLNTFDEIHEDEKRWLTSDLPVVENGIVKVGEEIASIVALVVAIAVFNLYIANFTVFYTENGSLVFVKPEYNNLVKFIPYLTIIWVYEIIFRFATIKFGIKKYFTFLSKIAIGIAGIVVAGMMIYTHSQSPLIAMGESQNLYSFNNVINIITYVFLLALFLPNLFSVFTSLYNRFKIGNLL